MFVSFLCLPRLIHPADFGKFMLFMMTKNRTREREIDKEKSVYG